MAWASCLADPWVVGDFALKAGFVFRLISTRAPYNHSKGRPVVSRDRIEDSPLCRGVGS